MIDPSAAFYLGTNQYTRNRKLQHEILSHLGWNVRRVRYDDWFQFEPGTAGNKKREFLLNLLSEAPTEKLLDRDECSREAVGEMIGRKKAYHEEVARHRAERAGRVEIEF